MAVATVVQLLFSRQFNLGAFILEITAIWIGFMAMDYLLSRRRRRQREASSHGLGVLEAGVYHQAPEF